MEHVLSLENASDQENNASRKTHVLFQGAEKISRNVNMFLISPMVFHAMMEITAHQVISVSMDHVKEVSHATTLLLVHQYHSFH